MLDRRSFLSGLTGLGVAAIGGVALAEPAFAVDSTFIITNCNVSVNRRSGPGTGYRLMGSIARGTSFSGQQSGGWVRITSGPFVGQWVSAVYAAPIALPPTSRYVTAITPVSGGVTIKDGWNGTRVYVVRKHFGLDAPTSKGGTYDAATKAKVTAFQRSKRLGVDGVVGTQTWAALSTGYPFTIDAFQEQPQLPLSASDEQRRETMIGYALKQRGSRYTWGGAGPYTLGYDCSGLVLQALYASGYDPQPITVVKHAEPTYRTSQQLYAHTGMRTLPSAQRQRGDLIFYQDRSGAVVHVAIYLGDGTMMEAYGATAGIRGVTESYGASHLAPNLKRPF